jgi:hypothetical protein
MTDQSFRRSKLLPRPTVLLEVQLEKKCSTGASLSRENTGMKSWPVFFPPYPSAITFGRDVAAAELIGDCYGH